MITSSNIKIHLLTRKKSVLSLYGLAFKNLLPMKLEVSSFFRYDEERGNTPISLLASLLFFKSLFLAYFFQYL